jgi:hypothetical protein
MPSTSRLSVKELGDGIIAQQLADIPENWEESNHNYDAQ